MAIERHPNRHRVAQAIVEQAQVELVDRRVHDEVIDVRELADHAKVAAGDGGRIRRELRIEGTQIRVERRIGHRQRHVGVHRLVQRDRPRAGDRKTR